VPAHERHQVNRNALGWRGAPLAFVEVIPSSGHHAETFNGIQSATICDAPSNAYLPHLADTLLLVNERVVEKRAPACLLTARMWSAAVNPRLSFACVINYTQYFTAGARRFLWRIRERAVGMNS